MYKATYQYSNLFTLKKYDDSNLNCQSYEYMTIYGIRSAILGQIITQDGIERAKDLFHKVKNSVIYIEFPDKRQLNAVFQRRRANTHYKAERVDVDLTDIDVNSEQSQTMGFRQYYHIPEVSFYIDRSIPDIERYLKGIDYLGNQKSMVWLSGLEVVIEMTNIMTKWDGVTDEYIYENYDWGSKTEFEHVYMFGEKYDKRRSVQQRQDYVLCDAIAL